MNNSCSTGVSYKGLVSTYNKYIKGYNTRLLMHPETLSKMNLPVEQVNKYAIEGIPVNVSEFCPKHPKKWEFPKCRFVEYEPKDEEWARPVRHGREVDDTDKYIAFEFKDYSFTLQFDLPDIEETKRKYGRWLNELGINKRCLEEMEKWDEKLKSSRKTD